MYEISDCGEYLLVEFRGSVRLETIMSAISEVMNHPNYSQRNDIWQLGSQFIDVAMEKFPFITGFVEDGYPQDATRAKTALVSTSGFNAAIAVLWAETARHLPFEVQIFDNMEAAIVWVTA